MKTFATILLIACAVGACDNGTPTDTTRTTSATTTAPDNTKTNARDTKGATVTPVDQGNNAADLDVTQAIRKSLMADDALSMNAKNVKVITGNGVITLRGPVKTDAEKKSVEAKATAAAGSNRVDDQLDVQAN